MGIHSTLYAYADACSDAGFMHAEVADLAGADHIAGAAGEGFYHGPDGLQEADARGDGMTREMTCVNGMAGVKVQEGHRLIREALEGEEAVEGAF